MSPACTCGHPREAHQHHRPGTDCALCHETTRPCTRYRRRWIRALARWAITMPPHPAQKPPAGRDSAATPPSPRPAQPGHTCVQLPLLTHPGDVGRLALVVKCKSGGYCLWVWRDQGRGWHHDQECVKVPTPEQWDTWAAMLGEEQP